MTDSEKVVSIPTAEETYQEEVVKGEQESTYQFQHELLLQKIGSINKQNPSVIITFKGRPSQQLVEQLESGGYIVKVESYYDSSKEEKWLSKIKVTNPKFQSQNGSFMDRLEDQMKSCSFAQGNIELGEDAKRLLESFLGGFHK